MAQSNSATHSTGHGIVDARGVIESPGWAASWSGWLSSARRAYDPTTKTWLSHSVGIERQSANGETFHVSQRASGAVTLRIGRLVLTYADHASAQTAAAAIVRGLGGWA